MYKLFHTNHFHDQDLRYKEFKEKNKDTRSEKHDFKRIKERVAKELITTGRATVREISKEELRNLDIEQRLLQARILDGGMNDKLSPDNQRGVLIIFDGDHDEFYNFFTERGKYNLKFAEDYYEEDVPYHNRFRQYYFKNGKYEITQNGIIVYADYDRQHYEKTGEIKNLFPLRLDPSCVCEIYAHTANKIWRNQDKIYDPEFQLAEKKKSITPEIISQNIRRRIIDNVKINWDLSNIHKNIYKLALLPTKELNQKAKNSFQRKGTRLADKRKIENLLQGWQQGSAIEPVTVAWNIANEVVFSDGRHRTHVANSLGEDFVLAYIDKMLEERIDSIFSRFFLNE